jgi:predicted DNA-binding transcriptional regulator AlpA
MITNSNDEILTEREVCHWLGVSEPTLFRHRRDGTGPKFIRLSARRVAYSRRAVVEWLKKRECESLNSTTSAGDGKRIIGGLKQFGAACGRLT